MNKFYCILPVLSLSLLKAAAQHDNYYFNTEAIAGYISPDKMPFWLRSNQYGSVPLNNASLSLIASAGKDYDADNTGIFDWGAAIEGRLNAGNKSNFTLVEGYGKVRISVFEIRAGRVKEITGLCDTSLTSGSWSVSGNAPGIPGVQLSITKFYSIPWFGKLFAFKGSYSHGWLGETIMRSASDTMTANSFLHQKTLYGRFGKPEWKWKLYAGFNHQAKWGDEQEYYNDDFTLSVLETYLYLITGKRYTKGSIQMTRLGDHLGSIDLGIEYEFNKIKVLLYRQNLYEAGALIHLANIQDGLNGISFENRSANNTLFRWKKILFEFLYTKNQAGEPWSPYTTSPYEPYYNHYQYAEGWSYKGIGLGTPFVTTRDYIREGLPTWPDEYFINNRVRVFHLGFEGAVQQWDYTLKASWSDNFGTYSTSDEEQSTGITNPGSLGVFGKQDQFSAWIDCRRPLKNGFNVGGTAAFDVGELFYDSFGILLRVGKVF